MKTDFEKSLIRRCDLYEDENGNLCPRGWYKNVVIDYFPGLPYPWLAHPKHRRDGPPRETLVEALADLLMWGDVALFLKSFRITEQESPTPGIDNR